MKYLIVLGIIFVCCLINAGEPPVHKSPNIPTPDEIEKMKQSTMEELLSMLRDYGAKSEEPGVGRYPEAILHAIFAKADWLKAIDPIIEIYKTSSNYSVKFHIVEIISGLPTTRKMTDNDISKIQSLLISELEKNKARPTMRAELVRGLGNSVTKPFQTEKEKQKIREKGINPDTPLCGKDKVINILEKFINDENVLVRIETISYLQEIGDSSTLPALENRLLIEEDAAVKKKLEKAIQKFKN